jgi:hypothetical protein
LRTPMSPVQKSSQASICDNEEGSVWSRGEMPAADTERDHIEAVLN